MLKYCFETVLSINGIEEKTPIKIFHSTNENEITTEVVAILNYSDVVYRGVGDNYYWIDAIADLQNNLPEGVKIKSCLTCRHGSMCPVGNNTNEVFCVKDIVPKNKKELYFYTEDYNERDKRSREYFSCCDDFERQSKEYYTYNDYLCFLEK